MPAPLHVSLDAPLPERLAAGRGTALFVGGWCASPAGRVRALEVLVGDTVQPVPAVGMPRKDAFAALHPGLDLAEAAGMTTDPASAQDPGMHGYRSGFWAVVRIPPAHGTMPWWLRLRATLEDGTQVVAPLATIEPAALPEPLSLPAPAPEDGPLVAVCMATYEAPAALFARQLESIRAQTHRNWVLVIADDASSPERLDAVRAAVGDDPRVAVVANRENIGFYRNFERALALAPRTADLVALADQDDAWHPDKLATLIAAMGDAQLAYSDMRVVDEAGGLRAPTYWDTRANNHDDLLSLLVTNSVSGAATLMRREVLDDALPFPPAQFKHFHDHWIAVVARARGRIAFVDRPLYDYVQHGDATLGHEAANRMPTLLSRVAGLRRSPRARVGQWRAHYFADASRLLQFATVVLARLGDRLRDEDRAVLEGFMAADRSGARVARLALRGGRDLLRRRSETLGGEWLMAYAFGWRRLIEATAADRPGGVRPDAGPPPADVIGSTVTEPGPPEMRFMERKTRPLALRVRAAAPARINLLVPTLDLDHFFGGYIAKFNLARRLAAQGRRVRIVTVDPVPSLPGDWRARIEAYEGLDGVLGELEVAYGREDGELEVSPDDRWIATTWWTAHIADAAVRELGGPPFLYLVQEHEPFTFPMGTWAALAEASYRFDHTALYSTELLREYFRRHRLGPFAGPDGDARSVAFRNAITAVSPGAGEPGRRLLFYARPEPHAARNLFELGALGLRRAAATGALAGWELRGIGTTALGRQLDLGGATLELLPRTEQATYGRLLAEHDVGLALMHTPHPSLVPIEMAAAGLVTVTSTFEHKDAAALAAISPNLVGAEPTVDGVAEAIVAAVARAADRDARLAGAAATDWARDWDAAFGPELVARVLELLR